MPISSVGSGFTSNGIMLSPGFRRAPSSGLTIRPVTTTSSATPSATLTPPCSATPEPSLRSSSTPRNAVGIEPIISHLTSGFCTVPRCQCTAPPIGFITIDATMSLDTAVSGSTPNSSTRIGVISAPPPMPVRPTTKTDAEAAQDDEGVEHTVSISHTITRFAVVNFQIRNGLEQLRISGVTCVYDCFGEQFATVLVNNAVATRIVAKMPRCCSASSSTADRRRTRTCWRTPATRDAVLIDPVFELYARDAALVRELDLTLRYTLETHVHADHVTAAWLFRERLGSAIVVSADAGSRAPIGWCARATSSRSAARRCRCWRRPVTRAAASATSPAIARRCSRATR